MDKYEKAMLRSLGMQLLLMAMMKAPKQEKYLAAAEACETVAERLRERAERGDPERDS